MAARWNTFEEWKKEAEERDRSDPDREEQFWRDTYSALQDYFSQPKKQSS